MMQPLIYYHPQALDLTQEIDQIWRDIQRMGKVHPEYPATIERLNILKVRLQVLELDESFKLAQQQQQLSMRQGETVRALQAFAEQQAHTVQVLNAAVEEAKTSGISQRRMVNATLAIAIFTAVAALAAAAQVFYTALRN